MLGVSDGILGENRAIWRKQISLPAGQSKTNQPGKAIWSTAWSTQGMSDIKGGHP